MTMEMIIIFLLFLATTFAVSIFVNFLNRDGKRLPWKNVFTFAVLLTIIFCGGAFILSFLENQ